MEYLHQILLVINFCQLYQICLIVCLNKVYFIIFTTLALIDNSISAPPLQKAQSELPTSNIPNWIKENMKDNDESSISKFIQIQSLLYNVELRDSAVENKKGLFTLKPINKGLNIYNNIKVILFVTIMVNCITLHYPLSVCLIIQEEY